MKRLVYSVSFILLVTGQACADGGEGAAAGEAGESDESAEVSGGDTMSGPISEVVRANAQAWMAVPGVVGVAEGECGGEPCIKVLVAAESEVISERIPSSAGGFTVELQVTGEFQALDTTEASEGDR